MFLELVPEFGFISLSLEQAHSYSLINSHIELPNCDIYISFNSWVDVLLEFLILQAGKCFESLQWLIKVHIPLIVGHSFSDFVIKIFMFFEQIQPLDDPSHCCYLLEPSFSTFPQTELSINYALLVSSQNDSRIFSDDICEMLEKNYFFVERRLFNQKGEYLINLHWQLHLMKFTADRHIDNPISNSFIKAWREKICFASECYPIERV
jgi:hypothetical protein